MEPIASFLRRRLKEVGKDRWPALAEEVGCNFHTLRKFVHSDADSLNLRIVQGLLDIFAAIERGERELPTPTPTPDRAAV